MDERQKESGHVCEWSNGIKTKKYVTRNRYLPSTLATPETAFQWLWKHMIAAMHFDSEVPNKEWVDAKPGTV